MVCTCCTMLGFSLCSSSGGQGPRHHHRTALIVTASGPCRRLVPGTSAQKEGRSRKKADTAYVHHTYAVDSPHQTIFQYGNVAEMKCELRFFGSPARFWTSTLFFDETGSIHILLEAVGLYRKDSEMPWPWATHTLFGGKFGG